MTERASKKSKTQTALEHRRATRKQRYAAYREARNEDARAESFFKTAKRLGTFIGKQKKLMTVVIIACAFFTVCNVLGPSYIGDAIDVLNDQISLKLAGEELSAKPLIPYIIYLVVIYGGMSLFSYIQEYSMATATAKIVRDLRERINDKLSNLPLKYFDTHAKGDLLSRMMNDVDNISNTLQNNLIAVICSAAQLVGIFFVMLYKSWFLTLAIVLILPLSAFVAFKILTVSRKLFKEQWDRMGELNGHVEEMYTGHKIVKIFGQEKLAEDEFDDINTELTAVSRKAQFVSGSIHPFINLMDNVGYILIAVIGGYLIVNNGVFSIGGTVLYDMGKAFSIGGILTFITYSKLFTSPISNLAQISNNLQSCMASAERVFVMLDEKSEDNSFKTDVLEFNDELRFNDVSFSYSEDKPLMKNMDFTVKKGSLTALVGPTGAGKTTFVNLLMRFYDVTGGSITIDKTDIRDVPRDRLRSLFGMVLQDTWLFDGTVLDNIRYGRLSASDEEVIAAARAARADEFISLLPEGYNTRLDENGANISQGQRQLITIARALLKDPQILILDEATSSVDTRTELLVQDAMSEIMKGRTNFVIAHRLSTIKKADEILFIDNGSIKERGTHEELLKKGGYYADMYRSQFGERVSDRKLETDY